MAEELEALPVARHQPAGPTDRRWMGLVALSLIAAVALPGAFALGERRTRRPPAAPTGSGFTWACDGAFMAAVHFDGLSPGGEVGLLMDLRGDGTLLPLTGEMVNVASGRAKGHQGYLPFESGELVVVTSRLLNEPHRAQLMRPSDGAPILDFALRPTSC